MAHVRQELALGTVGGLGGDLGRLEFFHCTLAFGDVLHDAQGESDLTVWTTSGSGRRLRQKGWPSFRR